MTVSSTRVIDMRRARPLVRVRRTVSRLAEVGNLRNRTGGRLAARPTVMNRCA